MTDPGSADRGGKIVTFYSYKGGTGRSMALANIAWVLASSGKRVLAVDWDLEAPGLHRYFEPFLADKTLEQSTGVIDFVRDFAVGAIAAEPSAGPEWYEKYSDLLAHAMSLEWDFGHEGALHMVSAGKQDAAYPIRVNTFDWRDFYERLGGGILLELVKKNLRRVYDFILIDSRTGVSDTSGICTMQMPDELVVCFTLNRQSIYGASSAARSAYRTRHTLSGEPTLKIWPVPTRVEAFEKDRLELALSMARARLSGVLHQLDPEQEDRYWDEIAVAYEPYYAYEEVLAAFRDRPRQTSSMLARMEIMASYLNGGPLSRTETIDEGRRAEGLAAFTARSAQDYGEELAWLGEEYERIRKRTGPGAARTELMALLVGRAQGLGGQHDAGIMAEKLFSRGTDGARVVGLALARKDPQRQHVELALSGIRESRSAFEQYHALLLADALVPTVHPTAAAQLQSAIRSQLEKTISRSDPSRWAVAQRLIKKLDSMVDLDAPQKPQAREFDVGGQTQVIVSITPSSTYVRYDDGDETHGPWVKTRGIHAVRLPPMIRMGRYLVTNAAYLKFVEAGGYENDKFWLRSRSARRRFVTSDGKSLGPGHWPNSRTVPKGEEEHPVGSISYVEALAFVNWCNALGVGDSDTVWSLPPEDQWEFAARSEQGFLYPWGDVFDASLCNSAETGIGGTSSVRRFEAGASKGGCCDMAGNVWEFVLADDAGDGSCVLRGGSFSNNLSEVRSYLRLFGVPQGHRPPDFGFRMAQVDAAAVRS
jgi:formylglycine-generating enzyme required for sulfatase activity